MKRLKIMTSINKFFLPATIPEGATKLIVPDKDNNNQDEPFKMSSCYFFI
ncbi:MAG: hypothetical protein R6W78_00665 [Bacteroidales bacterium]